MKALKKKYKCAGACRMLCMIFSKNESCACGDYHTKREFGTQANEFKIDRDSGHPLFVADMSGFMYSRFVPLVAGAIGWLVSSTGEFCARVSTALATDPKCTWCPSRMTNCSKCPALVHGFSGNGVPLRQAVSTVPWNIARRPCFVIWKR